MKLGALLMPSHPPERSIGAGQLRDLEEIALLDALGVSEAWVGEHFTAPWEPCPAPDLLIAQALTTTRTIKLGPLGHLLPYHHPVELAHRVAYLDHLARGRYQLGVGISALPSDHQLFDLDVGDGRNRRMTYEALDIMVSLWTEPQRPRRGEFWSTGSPATNDLGLGVHLEPLQRPHPPIAIAGMTPNSANHRLAGRKGYIPVSFAVSPNPEVLVSQWRAVEDGARSIRVPDRRQWRIVRDVYVAPTDAEAKSLALDGMMGRCWREFLLPLYLRCGLGPLLKHDPAVPDGDLTVEYVAEHLWLTGSPQTVAEKITDMQASTGGFGYLIAPSYDSGDDDPHWSRHLRMLVDDVLPACHMPVTVGAGSRS